jgi:hypothetical protein
MCPVVIDMRSSDHGEMFDVRVMLGFELLMRYLNFQQLMTISQYQ